MYELFLTLHNLLRWVIVLAGVFLLVRSAMGLGKNKDWEKNIVSSMRWYTLAMDIELTLGLILYFGYSPLTQAIFQNFFTAMQIPLMRFYGINHVLLMLTALVLAHIGHSRVKKALTATQKYQQTLLWFGLSFTVLLCAIPWPFLSVGRPILRLFGFSF